VGTLVLQYAPGFAGTSGVPRRETPPEGASLAPWGGPRARRRL
jgi:hypothetical protein